MTYRMKLRFIPGTQVRFNISKLSQHCSPYQQIKEKTCKISSIYVEKSYDKSLIS